MELFSNINIYIHHNLITKAKASFFDEDLIKMFLLHRYAYEKENKDTHGLYIK
jgi:hypothetical protein